MGLPYCFEEPESKSILSKLCVDQNIDEQLIREICEIESFYEGSGRPEGVYEKVAGAMDSFLKRQKDSSNRTTKSNKS
jgi:hypothetical protein